ncbi:MAG: putative spermidine/putrescine transport system permease protein [Thermoleophilaceae bacterium]|nr:putative spermidine/putrescine transport system permease protein [Thermoleophilaceae bacterium]
MAKVTVRAIACVIATFLIAPTFIVVPLALSTSAFLEFPPPGWSTRWFDQFFSDPQWTNALTRSLEVATGAMVLAVVLGFAAAYALVRSRSRFLGWFEPVLLLPMMVPIIVYAIAAYGVALTVGLVGSMWLLMAAQAVIALPYVLLNLSAALRTTDPRLELVAQSLGAPPHVAFRKVLLPLITPAVAGAGLIAFALSLDETVVALFLTADGSPTLPVQMYSSIRYQLNPLVPVAATIMMGIWIVIVVLVGLIHRQALRRGGRRTSIEPDIGESLTPTYP